MLTRSARGGLGLLVILVLTVCATASASSQTDTIRALSQVPAGTRLRLTFRGDDSSKLARPPQLTVDLVEWRNDSLVARLRTQEVRAVPLTSLDGLERSLGFAKTGRNHGLGGLIGFVGGAAVGGAIALLTVEGDDSRPIGVAIFASLGGLVGGAVGSIRGLAVREEQWESLPLD